MFRYLIVPCYPEVDSALSNKSRDIGGGEEDECEREILDKRNVESRMAVELNIGAMKEV